MLSGRKNTPSLDGLSRRQTGDVAPQGRLNGTTGLPVGLHVSRHALDELGFVSEPLPGGTSVRIS